MSSNFYEDPDLMMKTRYSRGVGEEREDREEKQVDIYDSIAAVTPHQDHQFTPDGSPAVQTRLPRGVPLLLFALCVLLFVGLSVLLSLYVALLSENKRTQTATENKTPNGMDDVETYCGDGEQPEGGATGWQVFDCNCYYVSTDRKNWTDSRTDCQRRGADLVLIMNKDKQELVEKLRRHGDTWIGLETVRDPAWNWKWTWVDGTVAAYFAWQKDVPTNPQNGSKAYVVPGGTWMHTSTGTKHWICEKKMKWVLQDVRPGFHGD